MYSNPPQHGARLVATILSDQRLTTQWREEVEGMAGRIIKMREQLIQKLKEEGSTLDWSHLSRQIGMFAFTV